MMDQSSARSISDCALGASLELVAKSFLSSERQLNCLASYLDLDL